MQKLLIVDDQPHIIRIMKSSLGKHGYEVTTAVNGQQALEAVREEKPDFIFTDIEMPIMNGMTFCEELQAEFGDEIPQVLIISGKYEQSMDTWLEQFKGRVHFYEKPVSMSRMIELLSELQA